MAGTANARFRHLRQIWLSDGGYDQRKDGPYRYAHCRLTHIDGHLFHKPVGDDPVVGFLDDDGQCLTSIADLPRTLRKLTLALDVERLSHLLDADRERLQREKLTFTVRLQRITTRNTVARETSVDIDVETDNPLRDQPAADETARPAGTPLAVVAPTSQRVEDLQREEPADEAPPRTPEAEVDIAAYTLLLSAANGGADWRDTGELTADPIAAGIPVLESWGDPDFRILRLKIDGPYEPHRMIKVTFAIAFASQAQLVASGLLLKRQEDDRPLTPIFGDDLVPYFEWSWRINTRREYVLFLTSQENERPFDSLPFNPAAPFMGDASNDFELQPLEVTAWLEDEDATRVAFLRPVRDAAPHYPSGEGKHGPRGPITANELADYVAVKVDGDIKPAQVFRVQDAPVPHLTFEVQGAITLLTIWPLAPNLERSNVQSVEVKDSGSPVFKALKPESGSHWSVLLDCSWSGADNAVEDLTLTWTLRILYKRERAGKEHYETTEFPVHVTFKSRESWTVLAIDIGASTIAAAIATSEAPTNTALQLPLGLVNPKYDLQDPDHADPSIVTARVAVSATIAARMRRDPWYANAVTDPRLRDATPDDAATAERRLNYSRDDARVGRRMEVHLQALLNADDLGEGLWGVRDLKMEICRNERIAHQHRQRIVLRDEFDTQWIGASTAEKICTADLLAHIIEILLSIYVPDALDKAGGAIRSIALDSPYRWDARFGAQGRRRNFVLVLARPASISGGARYRYEEAAERALLQHFGPARGSVDELPGGVSLKTVSEALAVDAALSGYPLPQSSPDDTKNPDRRRIVIDIGSATTDVAVIHYPKLDGLAEVEISFALPIAAQCFRRWIASDIRTAASPDILAKLPILGVERRLDHQIDDAIRNCSEKPAYLPVVLAEGLTPPHMPAPPEGADGVQFVPIDAAVSISEYVALVPIPDSDKGSIKKDSTRLLRGLDSLATVIAKSVNSVLPPDRDWPIEIVLSGRGAAFHPVRHAIEAALLPNPRGGGRKRLIASADELLCPQADKTVRLQTMKSVVAQGAALRALSIMIGRADQPWNDRERYHRIVIGSVIAGSEPLRFERITSVHQLLPDDRVITRDRGEFWLARIIPDLKEADLEALMRPDAGDLAPDAPENVDVEIARACLVPVQRVGGGTQIKWTFKSDLLTIEVAGNPVPEPSIRLSDDGSYA
jgi:hypothetical protein